MYNLWYFVAFYTVLLPNLFFLAIYAVLSHYRFFRFTHYYVEKNLAKNSARGEKMTNMRYVHTTPNPMLMSSADIVDVDSVELKQ